MHRLNLALFSLFILAALPASAAPDAPKLLAPAHDETSTNARPGFTWAAVPGAAAYEIEVAADWDFKTIVVPATRVTETGFTPAKPLFPAQRFWRVRALDAAGNPGKWSATRVYRLQPGPKTSVPPSASAAAGRARPPGAPPAATNATAAAGAAATAANANATTAAGTAVAAGAAGAPAAKPGKILKLLAPANTAEGTNARPAFTWTPVIAAAAYEIEVAADYDFKTIVHPLTRVTDANFTPAKPLFPAQRFWRVRVIDAGGKPGPWSAAFVYKLKPAPLAETRPVESRPAVYPAHNQEGIVQNPSFTWEPEPGAAAYEIEIAADYDYKKIVVPVTRVETPRFVPLKPLATHNRFWRVRPVAADGKAGKWSETRVYKLREPANKIAIPAGATLEQIRAAIAAAPASSLITFAPGATYRLKPAEGEHLLMLEKRDDLILDGNDSLFIIETPTAGAIRMNECHRITMRRFRFDYDPLPHSVGTVVSVNTTNNKTAATGTAAPAPAAAAGTAFVPTITVRPLPGYPDFDAPHMLANWSFGMVLDPANPGRVKTGSPLVAALRKTTPRPDAAGATPAATAAQIAAAGPRRLFDIPIPHPNYGKFFAPGDEIVIFARNHGRGLCSANDGCDDITFDRVTTHACPSSHFSGINTSDLKILSSGSVLKDATRHYAGNADGAHIRANLIGPWMENCTFDSIGDDGVALYNKGMAIQAAPAPGTLAVADTFMNLRPGDTFVIFDPHAGRLIGPPRTVTATKRAAGAGTAARQWHITYTPALDPAAAAALRTGEKDWWQNTQLFNRTRLNAGFVIKNNTFRNVRRYSVIARSTDGLIVDNTIAGSSNSAITLHNEARAWGNGLHSERVLIAHNRITDSTFDGSAAAGAAIAVNLRSLQTDQPLTFDAAAGAAPPPSRLHRDIRIENNTITHWHHRAILLRGATDSVIQNNTIAAPAVPQTPKSADGAPSAPPPAGTAAALPDNTAIVLDNTANCRITANDLTAVPAPQRLSITNSETTTAENTR
jgi:hypothetical protein